MNRLMMTMGASALALTLAACGGEDADSRIAENNNERESAYSDDDYDKNEDNGDAVDDQARATAAAGTDDDVRDDEQLAAVDTRARAGVQLTSLYDVNSRDDIDRFVTTVYERADQDGDNELTKSEFVDVRSSFGVANLMKVDASGDISSPETDSAAEGDADPDMEAGSNAELDSVFFTNASSDDDTLSKSEMRSALLARFEKADENGDGELTPSEANRFAELIHSDKDK